MASSGGSGTTLSNPFLNPGTAVLPGTMQAGVTAGTTTTSTPGLPSIKREPGDTALVPGTGTMTTHTGFSDHLGQTTSYQEEDGGLSLYDAKQRLFTMAYTDQASFLSLQQKLIDGGFLDPRSRSYHPGQLSLDDATYKAYVNLARMSMASNTPIDDLLNSKAEQQLGSQNLTSTKTTHTSQIDLSDPSTVQNLLTDSMRRLLGRAPTPNEIKSAQSALNTYERANPQVADTTTTTTTQYDNGQAVSADVKDQSQVTSGGVHAPGQAIDNLVQNQFGKEADQHSISSYVQAFASMLGGGN